MYDALMISKLKQLKLDEHLKRLSEKYQRVLVPGLILSGFLFDWVAFQHLEISLTFLQLGIRAALAGLAILYMEIYDGNLHMPRGKAFSYLRFVAPLVLQFSFGSLMATAFIFYWVSGSVSVSWPIMLAFVLLVASNEVFRHYYLRVPVQVGVYAFVLFAYMTLLFPFLFHSLSASTFVLGGAVSSAIVLLMIALIYWLSPSIRHETKRMAMSVAGVFLVMNALYFLNVIPPIPLSIREAGIYHNVQVIGGEYVLDGEDESWLDQLLPGQTVHADPDGRVYAYTAIFAPTALETRIYHRWEYFDETTNAWVTKDRLSYSIKGGRDGGYRGYSYKTNLATGKWRVVVETERGQVLGRISFTYAP